MIQVKGRQSTYQKYKSDANHFMARKMTAKATLLESLFDGGNEVLWNVGASRLVPELKPVEAMTVGNKL